MKTNPTEKLVHHLYKSHDTLAALGTTLYSLLDNTVTWMATDNGPTIRNRREVERRRRAGAVQIGQLSRALAAVRVLEKEIPTKDLILEEDHAYTSPAPKRKTSKAAR